MIDPELEKKAADCKQMLKDWRDFRSFFDAAVKKQGLTPEREMAFLKVKSSIAMLHEPYLATLKSGHAVAQNIMQIVSRSITLKHVSDLSIAEQRKFEIEWHKAFLQMEETIAALDEERARIAPITQAQYMRTHVTMRTKRAIQSFFRSTGFKLALVLVIVMGLFVAGIIFNVPDRLYESANTRPFAFMMYKVMRLFNNNVEYRDIKSELVRQSLPGGKPGGWEDLVTVADAKKEDVADKVRWVTDTASCELGPDLMKATDYVLQTVHLKQKRRTLEIMIFQMPTVKDAEDIMAKVVKFLDDSGKKAFEDPDAKASIIRMTNALIVVRDDDAEYRNWILENMFNYKRPQS